MKLLSKTSAQSKLKQGNDELIETNIRLRRFHGEIVQRLNTVKDSYEPDKLIKLKEFEQWSKDLMQKKTKLLTELSAIEASIEAKKELYYSLITKQDALDEKLYQINEAQKKLDLREAFVVDLEQRWRAKQP